MGDDLTAFITARLDEDEAAAKAAAGVAGPAWKAETYRPEDGSQTRTCVSSADGAFLTDFYDPPDYPDLATHIARHDPARVLREVAAKRAILARWRELDSRRGDNAEDEARAWLGDEMIGAMAAAWSDHPDYRSLAAA